MTLADLIGGKAGRSVWETRLAPRLSQAAMADLQRAAQNVPAGATAEPISRIETDAEGCQADAGSIRRTRTTTHDYCERWSARWIALRISRRSAQHWAQLRAKLLH